ncbi:hypothetical protein ACTXG6_27760 [Pseudonocardia sp. Cha107L01]|uniref:hypothetical protein n=1 Tax=Pseudonocardia sp. Cha107L01 TaxID=3457576 RepID=UPI00403EBA18
MTAHPLDPLSEDEIREVARILRREREVTRPQWRIASIELVEPAKQLVREFRPGDPIERRARVVLWSTETGSAYVAVLSLTTGNEAGEENTVESWQPNRAANPTPPWTSGTTATGPCAPIRRFSRRWPSAASTIPSWCWSTSGPTART